MVLIGTEQIKLIDFGLSIRLQESFTHHSTSTMNPKGTLHFMAPELLGPEDSDKVRYSPRSDIWAFGCTVYHMATGSVPHSGYKNFLGLARQLDIIGAPDLPPDCSKELQQFYRSCVAKDPRERKPAEDLLNDPFLRN